MHKIKVPQPDTFEKRFDMTQDRPKPAKQTLLGLAMV